MSTTIAEHGADGELVTDARGSRIRSRNGIVIALVVTVLGLGAWFVYNQASSPVPGEIDQLIDDYIVAWQTQDEAAMREAVTFDFVITEYYYEGAGDRVFRIQYFTDDLEGVVSTGFATNMDWQVEHEDAMVTGENPWFISIEENWIQDTSRNDGVALYVVVEESGQKKIANHYWTGDHSRN